MRKRIMILQLAYVIGCMAVFSRLITFVAKHGSNLFGEPTATSWVMLFVVLALMVAGFLLICPSFKYSLFNIRRTRSMRRFADQLSLKYLGYADGLSSEDIVTLECELFRRGDGGRIENGAQGAEKNSLKYLFDYRWYKLRSTEAGREVPSYKGLATVLIFQQECLDLPRFEARPEGVMDRLKERVLGSDDMDFPKYPKFSKSYFLRGETRTRLLFTQEVIELFEGAGAVGVAGHGKTLIAYSANDGVRSAALGGFVAFGRALFEALKASSAARRVSVPNDQVTPPVPQTNRPHYLIIELLCCVMLSDEVATNDEKRMVSDLAKRLQLSLSPEEVDDHLAKYGEHVKAVGLDVALDQAIEELRNSEYLTSQKDKLSLAVEIMANSDQQICAQEQHVLDRIVEALQSG